MISVVKKRRSFVCCALVVILLQLSRRLPSAYMNHEI